MDVGPFSMALGRPDNTTVHAQFSRHGYNLVVQGDAELQRLLDAGKNGGIDIPSISGEWRNSH